MADRSANLDMPFIMPSQAQKHVTHNAALLQLDAVVHLTIMEERAGPPEDPVPGARYWIDGPAAGDWTGKQGMIAVWQDGYWAFSSPKIGWRAWFQASSRLRVFSGSAWQDIPLPDSASFTTLGVSAAADPVNRLTLSSPASLFNHAGAGHQLKINKSAAADTASLLFQSNWTGYAEMGLAGDTSFSIKVSNGSDWFTGIRLDTAGRVTLPNQPMARAFRGAGSFNPPEGAHSGFTEFGVNQGGFGFGQSLPAGGNAIVVPAPGTYLIMLTVTAVTSSNYQVTLMRNGTVSLLSVRGSGTGGATGSASGVFALQQSDSLSLAHAGSSLVEAGSDKTALSLVMI